MKASLLFRWMLVVVMGVAVNGCGLKKKLAEKNLFGRGSFNAGTVIVDIDGVTSQEQAILKDHLRVTGLMRRGDRSAVVINKQVAECGEVFTFTLSGKDYRFMVISVAPDRVSLHAL